MGTHAPVHSISYIEEEFWVSDVANIIISSSSSSIIIASLCHSITTIDRSAFRAAQDDPAVTHM